MIRPFTSFYIYTTLFIFLFFCISCEPSIKKQPDNLSTNNIQASDSLSIHLCDHCPPGFELSDSNTCEFVNPYQMYASLQNKGVGGLTSSLPTIRDGFTPQQIDLGRYLFFDPVLSSDRSMSCASCHNPDKGFSDGLAKSKGFKKELLSRGAPSLWNVAFMNRFFWDARANTLEQQMQGPLFAKNEMNNTKESLLKSLNAIPLYRKLFAQAFSGNNNNLITENQVYTALTAFECSLISLNSKYDIYAHGYKEALNKNELEGLNVFRSFVARCSECHTPPLFTNQQVAVLGIPENDWNHMDIGAEKTFNDSTNRGAFKVPSLRNIALTAPYSHAGVFDSLLDMVSFYNKGRGHAVPKHINLRLHWHIWEPNLTNAELNRLVDFLKTLNDESFKPQTPKILPSGLVPVHNTKY